MRKSLFFFTTLFTTINAFAQPANDEPSTAITLTSGVPVTLHFNGATPSASATSWNGGTGEDIFIKFTIPSTTFSIVYDQSTFSGTLNEATWVGYVSDTTQISSGGSCCGGGFGAEGYGAVTPGTTFYMGFYVDPGSDTVFTVMLLLPPANDNYTSVPALSVNSTCVTTAGTLLGATESLPGFPSCYGYADDDVWYSFTATDTQATVRADGASDLVIEIYENAFGFHMLDCDNVSTSGPDSVVVGGLTVGDMYYLRVYDSDFWLTMLANGIDPTFDVCVYAANMSAIAENKKFQANVSVYPNPVNETLNIVYADNEIQVNKIDIINLGGQLVQTQSIPVSVNTIHRETINVGNLPAGMYTVRLTGNNQQVYKPLIKN
jgi:hypothetical protein